MICLEQRAIVLLSGGIDSCVCAAIAARDFGHDNVIGLSIIYGQKHFREIAAASKVATKLGLLQHRVIELPEKMFADSSSSLVNPAVIVPDATYEELEEQRGQRASSTYVPFRNGLFLSIAAAIAMQVNVGYIFYGAHMEMRGDYAYPDCTPEFNEAMQRSIFLGTYGEVKPVAPLLFMTKVEIVTKAIELEAPLEDTYSCYKGNELQCGECPTCIERIGAFKKNGLVDPVRYQIDVDWR